MTAITTADNTANSARPAPRLVLHVGPGLSKCHGQADAAHEPGQYRRETTSMLSNLVLESLAKTGLDYIDNAPGSKLLVAPETLRTEAQACVDVMREFAKVRSKEGAALVVVSFSHGLINMLISAMVDIRLPEELAIVVHYADEREPTVHRMDEDYCLENWPYGILGTSLDEDTLLELGFDVPHKY
jgi:hypothetical protein